MIVEIRDAKISNFSCGTLRYKKNGDEKRDFNNCECDWLSIIIIYFENVHFFSTKLGLDVRPYEVPPHIPEYRSFRLQTKHFRVFYVIPHTFTPSLPISPPTSHPCHLPIPTGRPTANFRSICKIQSLFEQWHSLHLI